MKFQHHTILGATPGTQRELVSLHFGPTRAAENAIQKIYIQASLHADELPGMLVAHHLRARLQQLEDAGRLQAEIILVPMANPIGLSQSLLHAQLGRFEFQSGENFNRHYPALIEEVASRLGPQLTTDGPTNTGLIRAILRDELSKLQPKRELDSLRITLMRMAFDADVVLDLHCDSEAALHLYCGTPLWPAVEPLARYMGAHATLLATESGDNPFDEACSQIWWQLRNRFAQTHAQCPIEHGCISVTVELRGEVDVRHDLAQHDADNIIRFLVHRGGVTAKQEDKADPFTVKPPELIANATPLAGSETLVAPMGGLLTFLQQPGDIVSAGTVMAHVIDPFTSVVHEVTSSVDGVFYARVRQRLAFAGMSIGKVAGAKAFKTGKLLSA